MITTIEFAKKYGVTVRYVQRLCKDGRIKAEKSYTMWMIDDDQVYPIDLRRVKNRHLFSTCGEQYAKSEVI